MNIEDFMLLDIRYFNSILLYANFTLQARKS